MSHTRIIALLMVALAASAWHFANPPKAEAFAATCYYAGLAYSPGACRSGQYCKADGTWETNSNLCPVDPIKPLQGGGNT